MLNTSNITISTPEKLIVIKTFKTKCFKILITRIYLDECNTKKTNKMNEVTRSHVFGESDEFEVKPLMEFSEITKMLSY